MSRLWGHVDPPRPIGPLWLPQSGLELGNICVGMSKMKTEGLKPLGETKAHGGWRSNMVPAVLAQVYGDGKCLGGLAGWCFVLMKLPVHWQQQVLGLTRVLIKQERRRQKEYFEKNRLKLKKELLGVSSPVKNSTVSLDLLNLYMVNQISCKKKTHETVRKPVHVNMNRDIKMPLRNYDLELPMSPNRVPSKLCLDDTENNMSYQRVGSKDELGPVQSSQVMDSYSMFEPQLSRVENCSFTPPSFAAELSSSSSRHIPKLNLTPKIGPSAQKVAYEKRQNEQLNVNCSDSLVSKLSESQDIFSPSYKTAQFGTLFERLNSPGNRNFLTKRPGIIRGEDCGSVGERRPKDFITEQQSVQHIWEEDGKEVSNFLDDLNQPTPGLLSENCDSFISQNMINLLNIDQERMKKTFDEHGYDSMGDICVATGSVKNQSADTLIRNIFTVPELTFSNSTFNSISYPEKCQPAKNYQKEYSNNERSDLSTSFEKDYYPTGSVKEGKLENDYQEKTLQKNIWKHPVNSMGNIPLEELHSKQSWDFGLGEVLMEEGRMCSSKSRPTSPKKMYLDSSQGSQSTNYSPRTTDSCFSSSSEMVSEDEDQISQQIEDSNRKSIETKETTNNFHLERTAKLSSDRVVKNNAKMHKQNENFHQFSMKNNTDQFPQSECSSAHILQNKTSNNCILQVARCDAGVQTESELAMEKKLDAAVQCNIVSKCTCSSDTSLCNNESCSEDIKADTTGGQEILKNN
ncbi:regulator of DNA class I crossover intermediates 1 [Eulemur rufifrons]|uniref:regulator of DNA class I crossover intermediates 1 n=1 Tax=Eulemur rufifrons TaxID=859984 RepID=UPI003742EA41